MDKELVGRELCITRANRMARYVIESVKDMSRPELVFTVSEVSELLLCTVLACMPEKRQKRLLKLVFDSVSATLEEERAVRKYGQQIGLKRRGLTISEKAETMGPND